MSTSPMAKAKCASRLHHTVLSPCSLSFTTSACCTFSSHLFCCHSPHLSFLLGLQTPVMTCVQNSAVDLMALLAGAGAVLNATDSAGQTILHAAAIQGDTSVLTWALKQGLDEGEHGMLLLHVECRVVSCLLVVLCRLLFSLSRDLSIHATGFETHSPPRPSLPAWAIQTGPDARDKEGKTALAYASHMAFTEGVQLLISHGASVNLSDTDGVTPLHWASLQVGAVLPFTAPLHSVRVLTLPLAIVLAEKRRRWREPHQQMPRSNECLTCRGTRRLLRH